MGGTAREQILAAIERIGSGSGDTFTVAEILEELRSQGSDLAESTVRTHITSRMCGNSPDHHGTTHDDLERVGRGVYRLRPGR
jgi:tRNA threonylcarbamoyladenosine modification (KEOPS) complex Cgi121 subunit